MTVETGYELTDRIGVKIAPAHKRLLQGLARQRGWGCTLSDLVREVLIEHFSLPRNGSQPTELVLERYTAPSEPAGAPQDVAALPTATQLTPDPACVLCGGRGVIRRRRNGGIVTYVCSCAGDPRDTSLDVGRLAAGAQG